MEIKSQLSQKAQIDYDLVMRAMAGDQRAFAELLTRYRDSIYFMLLKMVNNPDDADDLTIEAFGKAFRNIHQYTPNFAFSTWLFKIATNNSIDFIRRKRANHVSLVQATEDSDEIHIPIQSDLLDPEENLINQQKISLMRDVVSRLKPHYRQLVEMRYFDELSYEEISEKRNLPIGTVKARLFRARELLLNIMSKSAGSI